MDEDALEQNTPLMSLRQIKACLHLLMGTLQLRCEQQNSGGDPRTESICARVFLKKRLRDLPETEDKNDKIYVLRSLYKLIDANHEAIFTKIGQVSGELSFLSQIQCDSDFENVEKQFIWSCDYLFKTGQLEEQWRGDFNVPETPEFEMPTVDEMDEEEQANFVLQSKMELCRQLGYTPVENGQQ
ncbi:hypothetical protein GCK72_023288 [Caenorhabditis remanei]|uniref:Uncharacterized protein n=1 Tax=Caenorhabditis remanei TaxID=31234 RepID=A0A6A5FVY3_CAERE|nr:hypothetical protein GCK72_023288 [Caenorhabditis remanei]KAF1746830.1 hypothetical protein GCK72_023288 [Caenorhabditis remanei]